MPRRRAACALALTAPLLTAPTALAQDGLEPGFTFRVYDIGHPMNRLYELVPEQTPNVDERRDVIDFPAQGDFGGFEDQFVVEIVGLLKVDEPGRYAFEITSDDGSYLRIRGEEIVRHDGLHPATSRTGETDLEAGLHPFRIMMFENGGGQALRLAWKTPGASDFALVPASAFRVERGITRVVSPGYKRVLDGHRPVRPGDGAPLTAVHPSWALETIRPDGFAPQVGGMDFLPDGRLVLSSFKPVNNGVFREQPNGTIWVVEGLAEVRGPADVEVHQIADGFHDPAGLTVVDGDIYVAHRTDITRLADEDGDGSFETREVFADGWVSDNYHHFTFGLLEHDGWLYGSLSTSIYFENTMKADNVRGQVVSMNGPNPPHRGTAFRVSLDTRAIEYIAGGFRTPNGIGLGPDGAVFVCDNQGAWLPSSKLIHVQPGRFFGHYNGTSDQKSDTYPTGGSPSLHDDQPESPPAVWMPQNEIANSPAQSLLIEDGPFRGQMLVAEITMGGLRRVFLERVDGEFQGAIFRHSQGFECGINRMAMGPDGCLYLGGTGAGGNWSWRGRTHGLQRLRPTGATAFEYESISATPDGFVVRFTKPIDTAWLEDTANWKVRQWHYVPTAQYGGPKHGEQQLAVSRATARNDGRSARLVVPGLREGNVVYLHVDAESADGESIWSPEAWYTLNRIPAGRPQVSDRTIGPTNRADLRAFRDPHGLWSIVGDVSEPAGDRGTLAMEPGAGTLTNAAGRTSNIATAFEHADIDLSLEFMVPKGSNSGVYFMGRYEIQVLDSWGVENPRHSDCGGLYQRWAPSRGRGNEGYDGIPPNVNASRPPGEWQTLEVKFRAPRFDEQGRKTANAEFLEVRLNGTLIHENIEATGPTRAAMFNDERPYGPLMLQGDHGPVAYRNIVMRVPG